MAFWRRYWYYIGGVLFVALAFIMGPWGHSHMEPLQVILVYGWMGMLMYQFEEYAFPGDFPMIANMVGLGETERPDRYPLNQHQCFISNVIFCYLSYIIPILFPQYIWMGASQVFAGVQRHYTIFDTKVGNKIIIYIKLRHSPVFAVDAFFF